MAIVEKELPPVELRLDQEIGLGAYGKVFHAKIGHLPCAAKLLHDTLSSNNSDPGRFQFVERFEKECEVLSTIKHPNIVQYLGTTREARSQRLALLMELMDENLTKFLERSPDHIPYHIQLNICHDVAIALSFLHSRNIIHRDLSSNNVLLFNEGSRAKISDLGMAKLSDMKANMATTTICPGATVYMPPEARISPPHYSNKLDCFSHGVLTIQILTKNFPKPGDAQIYHMDPKYGRIVIEQKETDRRKKDIELIKPDHPLLPLALNCLDNIDAKRPSAGDICEGLVELKKGDLYISSEQQFKDQATLNLILQGELEQKEEIMQMEKANYQKEIEEKERAMKKKRLDFRKILRHEIRSLRKLLVGGSERNRCGSKRSLAGEAAMPDPTELEWSRGKHASQHFASGQGTSAANDTTAYFSYENSVYSYTLSNNQWSKLPLSQFKFFSMAIIDDQLTTIGGCQEYKVANALMTLQQRHFFQKKWMEVFPPMNIGQIRPSVVVTRTNNLVVAGGQESISNPRGLLDVEVLDIDSCEWSVAENLPLPIHSLQMTECGRHIYILKDTSFYSCSTKRLLRSCQTASNGHPLWTKLANLPLQSDASLLTLGGNVVALGGHTTGGGYPSETVEYYDVAMRSWQVLGQLLTARSRLLPAVLPSRLLIVTGGFKNGEKCRDTDIGSILVILTKESPNSDSNLKQIL